MILKSLLPLVTKRHVERRLLPHVPADRLLKVVLDVNAYQDFLPYCRHSRVTKRFPNSDSFQATLTVGIPPVLLETYVSHVVVQESLQGAQGSESAASIKTYTVTTRSIQSQYLESLWSRWKLQDVMKRTKPIGAATSISQHNVGDRIETGHADHGAGAVSGGCLIEFEVEMGVRDPIIAAALDQLLPKVAVQQVDAFVARCQQEQGQ
jgi:ribosome-associated toxin RatA of RatAB toxin-antitoxin module